MKIYVKKRTTLLLCTKDRDGAIRPHLIGWKEENLKSIKTTKANRKKAMHRRMDKLGSQRGTRWGELK